MTKPDHYDIAAYFWPAYHDEPRWNPFFKGNEGEWEIIRNAKPRFEGHYQPRVPAWGYTDESTPEAMEQKIEAASSHGVNTFIFDWYWYDNAPFLEQTINEGFLKAKNNDKIQFYLMWANHDANTLWDLERSHDLQVIWPGAVDRATFDTIVARVIERYFQHPSYYKIAGCPVFSIYEIGQLISGLGGLSETQAALASFRARVKAAGFPDLHLQAVLGNRLPEELDVEGGAKLESRDAVVRALGIDSLTSYQYVADSFPVDEYTDWADKAVSHWPGWDAEFSVPYFPHVTIGWDTNPRLKEYFHTVKHGSTPENFKTYLIKAKAYADAHPEQAKLITVNSWNEWGEGSYLEPDERYGMGFLEAVKSVFQGE